jgi:hypothetical protein
MQVSRRKFINKSWLWMAGVGLASGSVFRAGVARAEKKIRLAPVKGELYSAGLLRFMNDARFDNPQSAIRAVRNQKLRFVLEVVPT